VIHVLAPSVLVATVAAYAASCGLFVAYLARDDLVRAGALAPRLLLLAAILHATHIVVASFVLHVCPAMGLHFGISLASLIACGAFLALRRRYRIDVVGAFVAPLALTFLLGSSFVSVDQVDPGLQRAILPVHVTCNLVGYAFFMLAFAAAVTYLVQERGLKHKHLAGLWRRLPPLEALDRAQHRFLLAGFPMLTAGILTGVYWAHDVEKGGVAEAARAGLGYLTWLLFAVLLALRAGAGWRGRKAAHGAILGFVVASLVLAVYLLRRMQGPALVTLL
jgi:ABC-type uncharacterized transport system permease subunit